jgi:protein-S-isoprenylcysteine O-methyltransferase Ste14
MALLLFVPAGTVRYWQAWVYLSIFFGAAALTTMFLMRKDPALLARRMSGGPIAEKRLTQKFIMLCTSLGFIAFCRAGARLPLACRPLPAFSSGCSVAVGFTSFSGVQREHVHFRNDRGRAGPEVIRQDRTIVRHPMYASALLYLVGTSFALGSYWGFAPLAGMLPFLIWRLFDEERFLALNLPGYTKYQKKVRHRLVPRIW